ncbi:hypothetical protein PGT21_036093 [Puccinia graminis f. sp. tritici]|uniref:Uncharacterized protein n=1 Tax=Puccinia graminis f. sp. tritici TaxID=56615 RepID=A0A5B0QCV7_PUCGR|nr:hypothetical protein PGTUg99_036812 [Puccinia graminis f. sp. tritici]KAA1091550.1 hypothetical protein PGT21_035498 [Puccinia graminis f. sp. tritici]KAA1111057.1 hypothetical protein PGT21_036093 [Puccinia graminis f. sp. tritici]
MFSAREWLAKRQWLTSLRLEFLFKAAHGASILRAVADASVLSMYDKLQELLFGKVYKGRSVLLQDVSLLGAMHYHQFLVDMLI